ncbi:hypothetical protein ACB092_04G161400 [Castanea dentata]
MQWRMSLLSLHVEMSPLACGKGLPPCCVYVGPKGFIVSDLVHWCIVFLLYVVLVLLIKFHFKKVQLRMTPLLRKKLNPNQNYSYHSPLLHKVQSLYFFCIFFNLQIRMTPLLRKKLNPNQNYSYHSPLLHQLKCGCEGSDQIESFDFESCLRPSEQFQPKCNSEFGDQTEGFNF